MKTLTLGALAACVLLALPATAQRGSPTERRVRQLDAPQTNLYPSAVPGTPRSQQLGTGQRPAIMLTGYWPPTNEAVRRFSTDPVQNPQGWIGSNWEGRGYDVYSFFPEFSNPACTFSCGQGMGDLEVDYQDTSQDFWALANSVKPIAIITFSWSSGQSWEVEMNQYNRAVWIDDFTPPTQPTPAPPDASVPAETLRPSTLPVQAIVDDLLVSTLPVSPFICFSGNGGGYLSEFMAYHGVWYQAVHDQPTDPDWCIAGGHVHVGGSLPLSDVRAAVKVTLRSVLHYVDSVLDPACQTVDLYCDTSANSNSSGASLTTTGTTSITNNDLRFLATETPPSVPGLLLYSGSQAQLPWGNGTRCISTPLQRLNPVTVSDAEGFVDKAVDFGQGPLASGAFAVVAGSTWNFQYAYRDGAAGGAQFNATNAAAVTFCP